MTDKYDINLDKIKVKVQEYEKPQTKIKMYSAKYNYKGMDYFLIGVLEKRDFEYLVKKMKIF